jgi:hypothetical protein
VAKLCTNASTSYVFSTKGKPTLDVECNTICNLRKQSITGKKNHSLHIWSKLTEDPETRTVLVACSLTNEAVLRPNRKFEF